VARNVNAKAETAEAGRSTMVLRDGDNCARRGFSGLSPQQRLCQLIESPTSHCAARGRRVPQTALFTEAKRIAEKRVM
jgi:hypothetical protein